MSRKRNRPSGTWGGQPSVGTARYESPPPEGHDQPCESCEALRAELAATEQRAEEAERRWQKLDRHWAATEKRTRAAEERAEGLGLREDGWRNRALAAEKRAEEISALRHEIGGRADREHALRIRATHLAEALRDKIRPLAAQQHKVSRLHAWDAIVHICDAALSTTPPEPEGD